MFNRITTALNAANLAHYLTTFINEKVTDEVVLDFQNPKDLGFFKEIIPFIGHRMKFIAEFRKTGTGTETTQNQNQQQGELSSGSVENAISDDVGVAVGGKMSDDLAPSNAIPTANQPAIKPTLSAPSSSCSSSSAVAIAIANLYFTHVIKKAYARAAVEYHSLAICASYRGEAVLSEKHQENRAEAIDYFSSAFEEYKNKLSRVTVQCQDGEFQQLVLKMNKEHQETFNVKMRDLHEEIEKEFEEQQEKNQWRFKQQKAAENEKENDDKSKETENQQQQQQNPNPNPTIEMAKIYFTHKMKAAYGEAARLYNMLTPCLDDPVLREEHEQNQTCAVECFAFAFEEYKEDVSQVTAKCGDGELEQLFVTMNKEHQETFNVMMSDLNDENETEFEELQLKQSLITTKNPETQVEKMCIENTSKSSISCSEKENQVNQEAVKSLNPPSAAQQQKQQQQQQQPTTTEEKKSKVSEERVQRQSTATQTKIEPDQLDEDPNEDPSTFSFENRLIKMEPDEFEHDADDNYDDDDFCDESSLSKGQRAESPNPNSSKSKKRPRIQNLAKVKKPPKRRCN